MLSAPTTFSVGGSIPVTMDTATSHSFALIRTGTATHSVNLDQRRIPLVLAQQTETTFVVQVPTNPVHVPPGHYWLFAMNAQGVPSMGQTLLRAV